MANYLHAETESKLVRPSLCFVALAVHEDVVVLARGAGTDVAQPRTRGHRARCGGARAVAHCFRRCRADTVLYHNHV